jgi:general secretion pathway protein K
MSMFRHNRQSGVALITAMLITVLATIAAVSMASKQHLDIRRTMNVVEFDQAYLFALGVETWAREILARDRRDNLVDHPGEPWATILPPIEVEGAQVSGWIEDLQGRFNLNNLVDAAGNPREADILRFRRLLRALSLDERLADAVVDWIDPDAEPRFPDGAEDEVYMAMDPPYRAANSPMAHPSELLLVRGFTPEIFEIIRPHVHTLPAGTTININTATAPVLMSVIEDLTESDAEQLIEDRGDDGYQSIEDFMAHPLLMDRQLTITDTGVASAYFMVNGNVRYGRNQVNLHSLVFRADDARVDIVMRSQGSF